MTSLAAPGGPARLAGARAIVPGVAVICVVLLAVDLGWLPLVPHAWAMNLLQYLPGWLAAALAACLLALCWVSVASPRWDRLAGADARRSGEEHEPRLALWALLLVPIVLWLLRERRLYGDSNILLFNAASGAWFLFPDIGATYLFQLCHRIGRALGWSAQSVVQIAVSLAGGITVACFLQVGRYLAWSEGRPAGATSARALLATALILGGGLTRVIAGHVEVYAFLLACAAAYLWAMLAYLRGRAHPLVPSLLAGLSVWMHLSGLFLLPSLVVALWLGRAPGTRAGAAWATLLRGEEAAAQRAARVRTGLAAAAVPMLLFLLAMWGFGRDADLEQAWRTVLRWTGLEPSPVGHEAFLRPWWVGAGAGTRYVVFSPGHLKYLANAFFLLAPAAFPVVLVTLLVAPRRLIATPEALVLTTASASLLAYASVVRPVWGPYDWDLFSLTVACVAALASYLLVTLERRTFLRLATLLLGATLVLVTIPFLWIGFAPVREAGPFAIDGLATRGSETPIDALERTTGPWL